MFELSKEFRFEASHRLQELPKSHKCHSLHGHSYRFEVVCRGGLDGRGFVIDYAEISDAVTPIVKTLDHAILADESDDALIHAADEMDSSLFVFDGPTSAERLARWLYERIDLDCLHRIDFYETSKTRVTYPI